MTLLCGTDLTAKWYCGEIPYPDAGEKGSYWTIFGYRFDYEIKSLDLYQIIISTDTSAIVNCSFNNI